MPIWAGEIHLAEAGVVMIDNSGFVWKKGRRREKYILIHVGKMYSVPGNRNGSESKGVPHREEDKHGGEGGGCFIQW